MEFHIARTVRERVGLDDVLFSYTGNVVFANVAASRKLAERLNALEGVGDKPETVVHAGALFAMGLIDELSHALVDRYRKTIDPAVFTEALRFFGEQVGAEERDRLLLKFTEDFPGVAVYRKELTAAEWLQGTTDGIPNREAAFEEMLLLWLANKNPAFLPFRMLFEDKALKQSTAYGPVTTSFPDYFATRPPLEKKLGTLLEALQAPMLAAPGSLTGQLDVIRELWAPVLGDDLHRVLLAIDVLREEEVAVWMMFHPAGPDWHRHGEPRRGNEGFLGDEYVGFDEDFVIGADGVRRRRYDKDYQAPLNEYEAFSADQAWMPNVVLIAKSTYVWLEQLSKKYGRHIHRLDQIPDEELKLLATRGITGLWLIGLWERSRASRTIKRLRGNADAVASAYSLMDYAIAEDLGGEAAYVDLRDRAARVGLRLASDMVPNHMGIDSTWVIEHPEWFIARPESPFPAYRFEGPDLSTDSRVEIKLEDHYYDQSDAAVVFRLRHHRDGSTRFMYHGNDGTTFAWNDTAQLDYSKAEVREHVIQVILDVARRFPIIRFDAAMVLAKRHVQRLWFPLPGAGGSIPSRAEDAMSEEAFNALMPHEFWREVVDRVAVEVPGTLLLAEAFWLLEGYFVRTLGMHRVYNSAFMNMLRDEENAKYRSYLKKTVEFDPDILKRYVNFMSNPDERTAIDQFGSGDKYFGVSVLLATLPGLPMFGHGQVEGYTERYGMDFKQARMDEYPNEDLVARHQHLIAPLLKSRHLFAEGTHFLLYDFWDDYGTVDENVFAYSNRHHQERAVILYNNSYHSTHGTIHSSVGFLDKRSGDLQQRSLAYGLQLPEDDSIVISYRDNVVGLEYLRRARDLRNHGLTVGLRGYQHMALLHWRELQPSASQPWDRLCDALNGGGVYSVEEALSKLQIRPLLDALRQAVTTANVEAFVESAEAKPATSISAAKPAEEIHIGAEDLESLAEIAEPAELMETLPKTSAHALAPPLQEFTAKASLFRDRVAELFAAEGTGQMLAAKPEDAGDELSAVEIARRNGTLCRVLTNATVHLPAQVAAFPKGLRRAAKLALPSGDGTIWPVPVWAPVMGWLAFQALPPQFSGIAEFERFNLRWALAETFASVGLEGEATWKAAAQVRILLKFGPEGTCSEALGTEQFWADPDVRWLAGVNAADGVEYINRERFEELLCWCELPALLEGTALFGFTTEHAAEIADEVVGLVELLAKAGYRLNRFLELLPGEEDAPEAEAIAHEHVR
jgi:glycosidase